MLTIRTDNLEDKAIAEIAQVNITQYKERLLKKMNPNTKRAKEGDLKHYMDFCQRHGHASFTTDFEAAKETIFNYVDHSIELSYAKKSIKRRLSTVSGMYGLIELKNPLKDSKIVTDYIASSLNPLPTSKQVAPIRHSDIKRSPEITSDSQIIDIRNTMILYLGIYTMCRASELLALEVKNIDFKIGTAYIARAKNDQAGEGRYANLSEKTLDLIRLYLDKTGVTEGIIIRRILRGGRVVEPLKYIGLRKVLKRVAATIMDDSELIARVNTHSLRVGSAVSLAEQEVSITEIALAGGWKSLDMPLRYVRQANSKKTGTARFED